MTRARRELVSLADTPYYHCICRCVRRAFLWGTDHFSGRDYSHRKQWVVDRLSELSRVFAVEVCAYAVMSNHYHLVVRIDEQRALAWSEAEVMERWAALFHLPVLLEAYRRGKARSEAENDAAKELIDKLRGRLYRATRSRGRFSSDGRCWDRR